MRSEKISRLNNFGPSEKTVFGDLVFGKAVSLNSDFVFFHDDFVSKMKVDYGQREGQCVIHDFNMRSHGGIDHPNGMAVDYHFRGIGLNDTVMAAITFGYRKIFFYPEWSHPGVHCSYIPVRKGVLLGYGYYTKEERNGKIVTIQKVITNTYEPEKVYAKLREVS